MIFLHSAWQLAWRGLRQHRRANLVMVSTLAVLAAVVTATLSLGHNLLVSPWTYDSDRYGVLRHGVAGSGSERYGFAPDQFQALRNANFLEALVASQRVPVAHGDGGGVARSRVLVRTTANALNVTDAQPMLGRFVDPGDVSGDRRVVLSNELWRSDFGANEAALGQTLLLDGEAYEIVGVMPPRFHFMGGDFWTAHSVDPLLAMGTDTNLVLNFKLRHGIDFDQAASQLDALAMTLVANGEAGRYPRGWRIEPLRVLDAVVGPQRPAMYLIVTGALALLLLGALNIAALLYARQLADSAHLATRKALGEPATFSVAVVALESLMISTASLLVALPLGRLLFDPMVGLLALEWVPRELSGAFAYTTPALWTLPLLAMLIAAILTAVRIPALLRADPGNAISSAPRSGVRRGDIDASRWLSGAQIAMAALILVSALAIGRGASALMSQDMGFDPVAVQHTTLIFPRERYDQGSRRLEALNQVAERLHLQGATAVAFTEAAPMQRYTRSGTISAASGAVLDEPIFVDHHLVHGDLAAALALRLQEGRFLDPNIDRPETEPVAVITRSLADRLAPASSALHLAVTAAGGTAAPVVRRIVGVVDDVRHDSPLSPSRPTIYVPYAQDSSAAAASGGQTAMLVRWRNRGSDIDARHPMPEAARIEAAIAGVDPWIAVQEVTALTVRAERSVAGVTLAQKLFSLFSLFGIVLATLGIAAVAELAVARQRHEIAVRAAVGATARQVLSHVLRGSLALTLPAALTGTFLAWLLSDALGNAVQGISFMDIDHALLVPALLLGCALLATVLPARKASRIEPMRVLKGG